MNPLDLLAPRLTASPEPFCAPLSRLLVTREPDETLAIRAAVYETSLSDTALATGLTLRDERGDLLRIARIRPDRIELRSALAQADLCFADPTTLALEATGVAVAQWLQPSAEVPGWPAGLRPRAWGGSVSCTETSDGLKWEAWKGANSAELALVIGGAEPPARGPFRERAEQAWMAWFAAAEAPRHGDHAAYLHAWWALAINQLRLRGDSDVTAVVPSKVGYVGLWQWDAYFAAIGLRHGQPKLALEQLELALRHQLPDGQLPDVVHDGGILHSVSELPAGDRARLAEHVGSRAQSDTGSALHAAVPVTKPPLGAWALAKVAKKHDLADFAGEAVARLGRAHEWWFRASDPDGHGLPRYLHPYSSGIDDCPVWDYGTNVATPDLGSYLTLEADALAELTTASGAGALADQWRLRADRVATRLTEQLWDPASGRFASRFGVAFLPTRTALDLMPLLTARLSMTQVDALVASLDDPSAFGSGYRIPTTAVGDPAFDPEAMWRGPVWLNTNYIVGQGLRRSGREDEADLLAAETLSLLESSPTIAEYWNPLSGKPAPRATAPFTWSAALYIDLAVTGGSLD